MRYGFYGWIRVTKLFFILFCVQELEKCSHSVDVRITSSYIWQTRPLQYGKCHSGACVQEWEKCSHSVDVRSTSSYIWCDKRDHSNMVSFMVVPVWNTKCNTISMHIRFIFIAFLFLFYSWWHDVRVGPVIITVEMIRGRKHNSKAIYIFEVAKNIVVQVILIKLLLIPQRKADPEDQIFCFFMS